MTESELKIASFNTSHLAEIRELSLRAWTPVFPAMKQEIPSYVYDAFYPKGWEARQQADIEAICLDQTTEVWVAVLDETVAGFVGLRVHEEDSMGEVHVIAVDPAHQRKGVGAALMDFSINWMRQRGLAMAMVETGGDKGHAQSRAFYESTGFAQLPVARYFQKL